MHTTLSVMPTPLMMLVTSPMLDQSFFHLHLDNDHDTVHGGIENQY